MTTNKTTWQERLRQLPQLYNASKGDIIAIESFISQEIERAVLEERERLLNQPANNHDQEVRRQQRGELREEVNELTWHHNNEGVKELEDNVDYIKTSDLLSLLQENTNDKE